MNQKVTSTVSPGSLSVEVAASGTKRRRWVWLFAAILALLPGLAIVHRNTKRKKAAATGNPVMSGPVTVLPVTARAGDIGVYLDAIGTVTPVYTDSITPQVTGVIEAVHYREGQMVRKGDLLIDIDARPYEDQLVEANGTLERDQNLLAQAQMDLKRYQQAWGRNAIPRQQLEDQQKAVLADQGTVDFDRGAVQLAQVQVAYCHITAPISGRVGLRLVDPGNLVTANAATTLVVITQLHPITVIFTLAEDQLPAVLSQLTRGKPLLVEVYDQANQKLLETGKLTTIDNQIDTTTGTVKLRAVFDDPHQILFPNEFVNTRLLVTTLHHQILIPSSAIQHNGDRAFVYLLQNGEASMRTITTGMSDRGKTAVRGVEPGEVVADSSFEKLQDGVAVVPFSAVRAASSSDASGEAPE